MLLARRPPEVLLGGLWELPGGEIESRSSRKQELVRWLGERAQVRATIGPHLASVEHTFTHRQLTLEVYAAASSGSTGRELAWYTDARWVDPGELDELPLSRLTTKVLAAVGYDDVG